MAEKCNGCCSRLFCMSVAETTGEDFEDFVNKKDCRKRVFTNADRIRAMSDEELEEQFCGGGLCSYIQTHDSQFCDGRGSCVNCIKEWLKQPAEE